MSKCSVWSQSPCVRPDYADDVVILSSSYGKMQGQPKAVNRHAAAVAVSVYASTIKAMLKTWATTIKTDLEPISEPRVFGYARWRKD